MDVTERETDPDIGMEFFDGELFYSLPRTVRADLTKEWGALHEERGVEVQPLLAQYVGRLEDALWGRGKYKLARAVVDAAQERRLRRDLRTALGADIPEDNFAGGIPETTVAVGIPEPVEVTPGVDTTASDVPLSVDEIRDALRAKGGAS